MRASLIAILVFAADRWTKYLVETKLSLFDAHEVIPGLFNIVRAENTGVAFGIFANAASQYRTAMLILFSVVALILLVWMLWRNRNTDPVSNAAMAMILGGAAGNVFDRIRFGSVTDFLDIYRGSWHWYTFNVADTAITTGAVLLLLRMMRRPAAERKAIT